MITPVQLLCGDRQAPQLGRVTDCRPIEMTDVRGRGSRATVREGGSQLGDAEILSVQRNAQEIACGRLIPAVTTKLQNIYMVDAGAACIELDFWRDCVLAGVAAHGKQERSPPSSSLHSRTVTPQARVSVLTTLPLPARLPMQLAVPR